MIVFENETNVGHAVSLLRELLSEFSANGPEDLSLSFRANEREDVLVLLPFLKNDTRLRFGGPVQGSDAAPVWALFSDGGLLLGAWERRHVIDEDSWDVSLLAQRYSPHELVGLVGPRGPFGAVTTPSHLPDRRHLAGCQDVLIGGRKEPEWESVRDLLQGALNEVEQCEPVELRDATTRGEFDARGTVARQEDVRRLDAAVEAAARRHPARLVARCDLNGRELLAGEDHQLADLLASEPCQWHPLGFELRLQPQRHAEANLDGDRLEELLGLIRERRIPAEVTLRPLSWRAPSLREPYVYWESFLQLRSLARGLKLEIDFQCTWEAEKPALNEVRRLFRRRFPTVSKRRRKS